MRTSSNSQVLTPNTTTRANDDFQHNDGILRKDSIAVSILTARANHLRDAPNTEADQEIR
jgi:hypothetical protein